MKLFSLSSTKGIVLGDIKRLQSTKPSLERKFSERGKFISTLKPKIHGVKTQNCLWKSFQLPQSMLKYVWKEGV